MWSEKKYKIYEIWNMKWEFVYECVRLLWDTAWTISSLISKQQRQLLHKIRRSKIQRSSESPKSRTIIIIIVSLCERSFFGSVTVHFSLEFFILFDCYFHVICCCCYSIFIFVSKIKLFFIIALFYDYQDEKKQQNYE